MGRGAAVHGGFEEEIDGGALVPDWRAAGHAHAVVAGLPLEHQVKVARGDEGEAGGEAVAVGGFAHLERAKVIMYRPHKPEEEGPDDWATDVTGSWQVFTGPKQTT